jgi:hypothetical protein
MVKEISELVGLRVQEEYYVYTVNLPAYQRLNEKIETIIQGVAKRVEEFCDSGTSLGKEIAEKARNRKLSSKLGVRYNQNKGLLGLFMEEKLGKRKGLSNPEEFVLSEFSHEVEIALYQIYLEDTNNWATKL